MTFLAVFLFTFAFILAVNVVLPYRQGRRLSEGQIVFVKVLDLFAVGVFIAADKVLWSL